jgi:hypothetical protein
MIKDESGNRRFIGVYRGIVVDNNDPLNKGRLRLQIPQVLLEEETGWAWAIHSSGIASVSIPVGTSVWVTFEGGDPSFPVWIGLATIPTDSTPTTYSPVFSSAGGTSQSAFTGTPATGSYIKQGKLVHFRIRVSYATMTSFGGGNGNQYYITLPFAPVADYVFRDALYTKVSNGNHYELSAHATANSTTMSLWHSAGSNNELTMNHTYPTSPATADYFYLSGHYEATT